MVTVLLAAAPPSVCRREHNQPTLYHHISVKMAEGELNVDSLISRLLEGEQSQYSLLFFTTRRRLCSLNLLRDLFRNHRGCFRKRRKNALGSAANVCRSERLVPG